MNSETQAPLNPRLFLHNMWEHLWNRVLEIDVAAPGAEEEYIGILHAQRDIQYAEAIVTCDWIGANVPFENVDEEVYAKDIK